MWMSKLSVAIYKCKHNFYQLSTAKSHGVNDLRLQGPCKHHRRSQRRDMGHIADPQ